MDILTEMMGESGFFDRRISYLGDCTWKCMSGRRVQLKAVPVNCLSELERIRLQDVAFSRLHQEYDLGCQITIPRDGQNHKKSLRRKLDSLSKEKNKDKEYVSLAFGIPLSQVIANDRAHKQRPDALQGDKQDSSDLASSILQFAVKRPSKGLSISNSSLNSTPEMSNEGVFPNALNTSPLAHRRGGMSVDSLTDLDDGQSRLLEALQLSLPVGSLSKKEKCRDEKLSLNPIYRLVPRLMDRCCQHLEKYGLHTVGIFRVGSSKKRVRQLREEFDQGSDVLLDEDHSAHDVAALLKEFLRDIPDPLLTKELYTAFISTTLLEGEERQSALQLLLYLLPPCNSDTLHCLLEFLSKVAAHAHNTQDKDGHEVTGNKMTSFNLATIIGPNLLHRQKHSDKEFSVQSSARAEDRAAVVSVVQRMINTYDALFIVPPDLQNEVLMSLLETDPDVVDYLLRRKDSQWTSMDLLDSAAPLSLTERYPSSDSNNASSGELSPYDNNSSLLLDDFPHTMGSRRSLSYSPPDGYCDQSGDRKLQWIQTSLGKAKCGPQAMVAWDNRSPQTGRGKEQLNPHPPFPQHDSHSEHSCTEELPQGSSIFGTQPCTTKLPFWREDTSLLSETRHSMMLPISAPHGGPLQCRGFGPQKYRESTQTPAGRAESEGLRSPGWLQWQREMKQMWPKLSLENTDSLPETPL